MEFPIPTVPVPAIPTLVALNSSRGSIFSIRIGFSKILMAVFITIF